MPVRERAGFIDAPQIGPASNASRPITAPTAMPTVIPFSRAPVETLRITNMSNAVRMISSTNDCIAEPAGTVAPSVVLCGKRNRSTRQKVPKNRATSFLDISCEMREDLASQFQHPMLFAEVVNLRANFFQQFPRFRQRLFVRSGKL